MQTLKAGILYFAIVFSAGFALGIIRTLWAVPRFGARAAELAEAPFMLLATIAAARWVVRRLAVSAALSNRLGMGCIALLLMLMAEFTLVLRFRRLTLREYFAGRDPVSGTVYYAMLVVFAIMPLLLD